MFYQHLVLTTLVSLVSVSQVLVCLGLGLSVGLINIPYLHLAKYENE